MIDARRRAFLETWRLESRIVLPAAGTVPMLFWALLASGQIVMRKVDGRQTLAHPLQPTTLDRTAR
jgi:hypothetical protein